MKGNLKKHMIKSHLLKIDSVKKKDSGYPSSKIKQQTAFTGNFVDDVSSDVINDLDDHTC